MYPDVIRIFRPSVSLFRLSDSPSDLRALRPTVRPSVVFLIENFYHQRGTGVSIMEYDLSTNDDRKDNVAGIIRSGVIPERYNSAYYQVRRVIIRKDGALPKKIAETSFSFVASKIWRHIRGNILR